MVGKLEVFGFLWKKDTFTFPRWFAVNLYRNQGGRRCFVNRRQHYINVRLRVYYMCELHEKVLMCHLFGRPHPITYKVQLFNRTVIRRHHSSK